MLEFEYDVGLYTSSIVINSLTVSLGCKYFVSELVESASEASYTLETID